jgi:hypothetical protein
MKKIIFVFVGTTLLALAVQNNTVSAASNEDSTSPNTSVSIEYKSAIIRWRVKNINGKAYKRRFNYSTDKWLGHWVPVE